MFGARFMKHALTRRAARGRLAAFELSLAAERTPKLCYTMDVYYGYYVRHRPRTGVVCREDDQSGRGEDVFVHIQRFDFEPKLDFRLLLLTPAAPRHVRRRCIGLCYD